MDEFKKLKQDIDQLYHDLLKGTVNTVNFVGGPKDGDEALIEWEDGRPKKLQMYFCVPKIFKITERILQAEYKWDIVSNNFLFTGKIKEEFL